MTSPPWSQTMTRQLHAQLQRQLAALLSHQLHLVALLLLLQQVASLKQRMWLTSLQAQQSG